MTISSLIDTPSELTDSSGSKTAIVLMTRVRLARNLVGTPFPGWAKPSQRNEIFETCRSAVASTAPMKRCLNIGVGELQEVTISKSMDKSSPKLMEAATKGKVFAGPAPRGSLSIKVPTGTCKAGARYPAAEFGTDKRVYQLTGVVVTHCSGARSSDGSIPTETLSLNFDKITWK